MLKIKPKITTPFKSLDNQEKILRLRQKFEGIFRTFTYTDFAHPITSKTVLASLDSINLELRKLIRK